MDEATVNTSQNVQFKLIEEAITPRSIPGGVLSDQKSSSDILALPERLNEMPEWLRIPVSRFLHLKQRNWPAKNVQRSTRQLFNSLNHITTFFIQNYGWSMWQQLAPHWLEDYIDVRLRKGLEPGSINWDLIYFRALCQFLIDEGFDVPESILKLKVLDTPRRLPRPLSNEQVHRLERCIQASITEARTNSQLILAVRDLACFYLLWHCGMRISEVCYLLVNDVDIQGRKLFISNSKERKDRIAYMSDTAVTALQQYLTIRPNRDAAFVFAIQYKSITTRSLQRRLVFYSQQCNVPVTAQRLRHTFASQMLAARMPVTSLQRYLGHEHLDTTMIYAEVSDPMLRQDYYQGIAAIDPTPVTLPTYDLDVTHQCILRQLIEELKIPGLELPRRDEILEQMQLMLGSAD